MYDECHWRLVLINQAAFQANNDTVLLAQSVCMQTAYERWLYGIPTIICTNDWLIGAETADADGIDWLKVNSVVVTVTEPLFANRMD